VLILPLFSVDGEPDRELTLALTSLKVEAALHRPTTLHAEFENAHTLEVGTAIQMIRGADSPHGILFDGVILAVELVFEEGSPPKFVVSAEDGTLPTEPVVTSSTLVRGQELVSARVVVKKAQAFVFVTGFTSGWPDFGIGTTLRLEHIGASFSGDGYRVTQIGHTFDLEHGRRSSFAAQRSI
jgi:hypothetical protein